MSNATRGSSFNQGQATRGKLYLNSEAGVDTYEFERSLRRQRSAGRWHGTNATQVVSGCVGPISWSRAYCPGIMHLLEQQVYHLSYLALAHDTSPLLAPVACLPLPPRQCRMRWLPSIGRHCWFLVALQLLGVAFCSPCAMGASARDCHISPPTYPSYSAALDAQTKL